MLFPVFWTSITIEIFRFLLLQQSYRMRQPRRSTITTVQLSELRKVSSAMRQEMSKLQQCNENEETSDIASSSTTSVITDTVQVKRCDLYIVTMFCMLRMCFSTRKYMQCSCRTSCSYYYGHVNYEHKN